MNGALLEMLANPRTVNLAEAHDRGMQRAIRLDEILRSKEARDLQGQALKQGRSGGPLMEILYPNQSPAMDRLYQVDPERGMETRKFLDADKLARLDEFTGSLSAATTPEGYAKMIQRYKAQGVIFGPGEDAFENRQKVIDQMTNLRRSISGGEKPTDDMREYQLAKSQGFGGSFFDYQTGLKQASGTNVSINNAPAQGETQYQKDLGGILAKRFEALAEEGDAAQEELSIVSQLRNIFPQGGVMTGVAGKLAEWGIGGEGMSDIQAAQALIDRLTPKQRVPGSGTSSDLDVRMFKSGMPSLWRTPEGNQIILDTMESLALYRQARGAIAWQAMTGKLSRDDAVAEFKKLPDPFATFKAFRKRAAAGQDRGGAQQPTAAPRPTNLGGQGMGGKANLGPRVGAIEDGFRFKGGDPSNRSNWEDVR